VHALAKGMLVPLPRDPYAAHYYLELDILAFIEKQWGRDFAEYMERNYEPADGILFRLAENHSIVLLNGGGFDGPPWSVRVSMANLPTADYGMIGAWLAEEVLRYKARSDASRPSQPG
jgi:aspartate 4-decarboxylase